MDGEEVSRGGRGREGGKVWIDRERGRKGYKKEDKKVRKGERDK